MATSCVSVCNLFPNPNVNHQDVVILMKINENIAVFLINIK